MTEDRLTKVGVVANASPFLDAVVLDIDLDVAANLSEVDKLIIRSGDMLAIFENPGLVLVGGLPETEPTNRVSVTGSFSEPEPAIEDVKGATVWVSEIHLVRGTDAGS